MKTKHQIMLLAIVLLSFALLVHLAKCEKDTTYDCNWWRYKLISYIDDGYVRPEISCHIEVMEDELPPSLPYNSDQEETYFNYVAK